MHQELKTLGQHLHRPAPPAQADEAAVRRALAASVVVLPAGGFGYRMRGATEGPDAVTQKALLPLPSGETLIGRLIREYVVAGCTRFLALVNHAGQAVEEHLRQFTGLDIRSSYDPDPAGSGRTGAMIHAVRGGLLDTGSTLVVHNADCQVMRYAGSFPHDLMSAHLAAVPLGAIGTLAAVDGTPYPFTGMSIAAGRVTAVEMYPFIPVPTHTGITVLTPEALEEILANPPQGKQNFERDMFPRWAAAGRLAAMVIPHRSWVAVDDRKAYRLLCEAVAGEAASHPESSP
jgi:NDP-sugar pyrophosphorylase family protein